MLTTTVDGLWLLQAVAGIERVCPELGLRPLLPRLDTAAAARRHPIAAELTEIGALDGAGDIDPVLREWLTVLARRDVALLVLLSFPGPADHRAAAPPTLTRAAICRFATWWVVLERRDRQIRLYPAGTATSRDAAGQLLVGTLERLCGVGDPARLRPITLPTRELLERVRCPQSLHRYLTDQCLDPDQLQVVLAAADPAVSGQASVVAVQPGAGPPELGRITVGDAAVLICDTPAGRVCVENIDNAGRRYQIIAPGSRDNVAKAVLRLMHRLPAGPQWHAHRRVV